MPGRLSDLPKVTESESRANVMFLLSPVFLDNPDYCFHLLTTSGCKVTYEVLKSLKLKFACVIHWII